MNIDRWLTVNTAGSLSNPDLFFYKGWILQLASSGLLNYNKALRFCEMNELSPAKIPHESRLVGIIVRLKYIIAAKTFHRMLDSEPMM